MNNINCDSHSIPATILVVDDVPDNLRLLQNILRKQGYDVRLATSGKLALRSLTKFRPDLILLDIMMPEMDGYQVCQYIKKNRETQDIPVIFLTALNQGIDKLKAFQVGGADYLTKPFQIEEALARIQNQLTLRCLQKQLEAKNQALIEQNQQLKESERETRLLLRATWAIGRSTTLKEAIAAVIDTVCDHTLWEYGEAWMPNPKNNTLEYVPILGEIKPEFRQFQQVSSQRVFTMGQGFPGQIWLSKQPEWLPEISVDSHQVYDRAYLALEAGLKSMLGIPILVSNEVLAILIFYTTKTTHCQIRILELMQAVATQLSFPLQQAGLYQQLKQANHKLDRLARLDGLTQVANRRHFNEFLWLEWRRMQLDKLPLSFILCDVDYFKKYNDTYGHLAGDNCLIRVAQAIQESAMRPGDLVARYGGEEFAIILSNTNCEGAIQVAMRIQMAIQKINIPHGTSPVSDRITVSQGIASIIPSINTSPEQLLKSADYALYQAKEKSRNTYMVSKMERE